MSTEPQVIHASEHSRFQITINGVTAVLEYHLAKDLMTIHHTFVPTELRGQNIAGQLAKAAFKYARAEQLQVIPQCSYIASYTKRFSEAQELVFKD